MVFAVLFTPVSFEALARGVSLGPIVTTLVSKNWSAWAIRRMVKTTGSYGH